MIDLNDIQQLNDELEKSMINLAPLHDKMRNSRLYYKNSAFFARQAGQATDKSDFAQNLLAVFADKNIEYTSVLPTVKVPTPGAEPEVRKAASMREKIVYAVRRKSNLAALQKKWAYDGTLFAMAVSETVVDLKERCVKVVRHDPRKCYWQMSNDSGDARVLVFWAVWAITADEAFSRYGVRPTKDYISAEAKRDLSRNMDGKTWFTEAIRWDGKTRTHWIGDVIVESPHNTLLGEMPIDVCAPIEDADDEQFYPGFYLDPLVPLQAELNDTYYRRGRIVRRMSSPVVWVRGVPAGKRLEDVKSEMSKPGGGVLGLSQTGEAGLLQLGETKMLNDHEDRTILAMTRLAGYGNAAFGESVGANTSGDALGMYFNATQRKIEHQWISWAAFHESINAKILRGYDKMLKLGETVDITGYAPGGTILPVTDESGNTTYKSQRGIFNDPITREVIAGQYTTVCIPPTATPKNTIEHQRLAVEAVAQKFMSRTTAYEEFGILSPEDELSLVEQEAQIPSLNPQGVQQLIAAMQSAQQPPTQALPAKAESMPSV